MGKSKSWGWGQEWEREGGKAQPDLGEIILHAKGSLALMLFFFFIERKGYLRTTEFQLSVGNPGENI